MEVAEYMCFSRQQGLSAYKAVTLITDVYGMYGLRFRPRAQRLCTGHDRIFQKSIEYLMSGTGPENCRMGT
ncbi:hypothetical protein [Kosakonia sp. 1610]|uniref:hypothetical protein n=1 Tax=Kosakonia sp. 1610 TaxID=3156426 RepID=UPI003D23BDAA